MLKTYLEISIGITAAILLILSLLPILKKRYTAQLRYTIWIVCALALIIPYRPFPKVMIELPKREIEQNYRSENAAVSTEAFSDEIPAAQNSQAVDTASLEDASETSYTEAENEKVPVRDEVNISLILTLIWLLGTAVFMLYYITGYAVFVKKIKPWCRNIEVLGYTGKPKLLYCKIVKSPMLIGFFRPRILLPRNNYGKDELSMILKHELTHYKRGDLWVKLLLTAANAIHWFNPAVYVMRRYANRDMEYSCDELVVKNSDREFREAYSLTILHCAARGAGTAFSTYFSEDKKNLKQRFKNILSGKKKRGIIIGVAAAVLAAVCAGVFGLGGETEKNYLFLGRDSQNHIDTIMLANVSQNGICVTSIPRDTLNIKRFANDAFQTSEAVTELMGVNIDKYLVAYTEDAEELLSKAESVKFEIPDLYGDGEGMVYDDPYLNLHINLSPGEHELTGAEMLQVMRYRKSNVKEGGKYNAYENGDLDRIKMTHSLFSEIIKQKKDILSDKNLLKEAYDIISNCRTDLGLNDVKRIIKAAKKGITFEVLAGKYEKDANGAYFYIPQDIPESDKSLIDRYDTTELSCEVTSLKIDGEEQLADEGRKVKEHFGIWYNKQLGRFHMFAVPKMKDGNFACLKEISNDIYDNYSAEGKFRFKVMTKEEAGETLSKKEFTGVITGLDTETPVFKSRDGKYIAEFRVVNRNEGYEKDPAEDLKERYIAIYGDLEDIDREKLYAGVGGNFCMPITDDIKIEEYDLNGGGSDGIEKLWNVTTRYGAEISIKAIDKVLDLPESEEVLKQRFYNIPPWSEDTESTYKASEYTISDFMRFLFCYDRDSGDGLLGYCYTVNFPGGGSRFIQEMPISDTKTLRISVDINTADENEKQKIIDIARTVRVVKNSSKP